MKRAIALAAALGTALLALFPALSTRADEFKLKDGTKITGTIVGFDENSFKVQTSYGFAIVKKDQVVSITITDAAKVAADKKPAADAEKTPSAKPANKEKTDAAAPNPALAKAAPASAAVTSAPAAPTAANSQSAPAQTPAPAPSVAAVAPGQPAPQVAPPAPEPIRERVSGNTYVNETYGFQMYKPPGWQVIAGARSILPGAIAAMGTDDQTTYLLIGQQPAGNSLATDVAATDTRLRDVMDNFRPLGETHITISGGPAVERRFRGVVDQQDWSGTVVFVPRGPRLYTIFGMTLADTDLVQIQENVIARAISSLQFSQ